MSLGQVGSNVSHVQLDCLIYRLLSKRIVSYTAYSQRGLSHIP